MYSTKTLLKTKSYSLEVPLSKPSQSIVVHVHPVRLYREYHRPISDELHTFQDSFAGMGLSRMYKPTLSPSEFPTLDTRPGQAPQVDVSIGLSYRYCAGN